MDTDWDDITDDFFALTAQLRSSHTANRIRAVKALERFAEARTVLPLLQTLSNSDVELRTAVMQTFGRIGEVVVPRLCELLQERQRSLAIRSDAATVLGIIGSPKVILPLLNALHDPEPALRSRVCGILGQFEAPIVVPALIACLEDNDSSVRQRSAHALAQIGDARAIPALIHGLPHGADWDRRVIAKALSHLAARHPVPELQAALPILRRLSGRHPDDPKTLPYRELMTQIQNTTDNIKNLPLPSMPAQSSLPLPAAPPASATDTLPIPAGPQEQTAIKRRSWRFWRRD